MSRARDLTLIVCTYNRANDLEELLRSAAAQETGGEFTYEIVIVDNNSSDQTRQVANEFAAAHNGLARYFFEPRQGKSYALNTALEAAAGAICAIGDDDLILPAGYLRGIWRVFEQHPEISLVGGRVLPIWAGACPPWLTGEHWSAVALTNYGDKPFYTDASRPVCLLAAAFRKADLVRAGKYDERLSVSGSITGGIEDSEIYARMYRAGMRGYYDPELFVYHKVEPHRMKKRYHRKWHFDRGRHFAIARDAEFERSRFQLWGVPAHIYRQAARSAGKYFSATLRGDKPGAFAAETSLWFAAGFVRERLFG